MNTAQLSKYAPRARRAFIAAVSAQAARLGITEAGTEDAQVQGDVLLVGGLAFPRSVAPALDALSARVEASGYQQTMEAIAYTWFNRLVAIRYMELHGYLDHGYRVLSHPEAAGRPEILDHAADVDLPGLDREKAIELKLDGTQDEALYRLLLLAQCNALHQAMPFLFEKIGDETELLLPANLLHTDSLVRQLVEQVDEALWQEIEIIGWLYQFYISEKKDQVIGKVVKSEDIPAATQLFTPNWIVKYMVQNSLGAQWLATYPQSPLKGQMQYYIEPAEQTDAVKAQLAAITPSQLNPEELTLIDPASGSGHILVEAYELFKAIYLERGYRQRDVPQLILEKNLFGLEICPRAAQLTGFALMMKGRADDRRLFERGVKLNVLALVDSEGFDAESLAAGIDLEDYDLWLGDLTDLRQLFLHATTFGSLIEVPKGLSVKLPALRALSEWKEPKDTSEDWTLRDALRQLGPLVEQAELLAAQYDAAVANPPYMGKNGMNGQVKEFAKDYFPDAKSDLYACFIERACTLAQPTGATAMVTMQTWMFQSSFEHLRKKLLASKLVTTMAHIGYNSFPSMNSKVARATAFTLANVHVPNFVGTFIDLNSAPQSADKSAVFRERKKEEWHRVAAEAFKAIPGSPLAYWVSPALRRLFEEATTICDIGRPRQGLASTNNSLFYRQWYEVGVCKTGFNVGSREQALEGGFKWFPLNKGGPFRRWAGNSEWVVNFEHDGRAICDYIDNTPGVKVGSNGRVINRDFYYQAGVTYSDITTLGFGARYCGRGFIFDTTGPSIFDETNYGLTRLLAYLNTCVFQAMLDTVCTGLHYSNGVLAGLPVHSPEANARELISNTERLIWLATADWHAYERSWDFQALPILRASSESRPTLESSSTAWIIRNRDTIAEMKRLEEENNRLFIVAYGLADELTPDVPIEQITLTVNPAYRYGGNLTEEEQWTRFRQDTMEELVSYAIGCMMGRYSLDAPGLIYAHSGNEGFDRSCYPTFPADGDGIVPLTDTEWFDDDAASRLIELISVAWDAAHLEANLTFLADNLAPKKNESSRETLRRYLCDKFFKDHVKTYKKRPIYWLFSSGKQRAFQCLVYLHRYNEGTLSRMRSEYVIPLQGKMAARLEKLQGDIQAATSTAQTKRLEKERAKLEKQQVELLAFDEKLRHYADMRMSLDLDDGVKANYGKFGDLLAEVKAVHGKKADS